MLTIDRAITEAQAEETAEREVNKAMESKAMERNTSAPVNNVTISLDEYLSLYNSTDKYCRLLAIIGGLVESCEYRDDKIRINDGDEILKFLKYNELEVYTDMLAHLNKGGEDV